MSRRKMEKPKNFKKTIKDFMAYIKQFVPMIILVLSLSFLGTTFQVLGPYKLKDLTDEINQGIPQFIAGQETINPIDMNAVYRIIIILALLYGIAFLISVLQGFSMARVTQNITKKMRTDINQKIAKLPIKYFDKVSYGDVLSRITNDVDTIGQAFNQSLVQIVTASTMFIGTLIMMFYTSWQLAIVAIISTSSGFLIMSLILRYSQGHFVTHQKSLGELNGHIEEIYSGHNVVRVSNAKDKSIQDFRIINDELRNSAWKSQFLSGLMMPLMQFIGNLGYVLVSIVGAYLALKQKISFGVIVAFMTYIRLFTQPLNQFAQSLNRLQSGVAAGERVFGFLNETEETEIVSDLRLENVKGHVEFKNLSFGYEENNLVIKDFNDEVMPGEKVAIVGPTGAGKTTLVNLLMRFYDFEDGDIFLDGISIKDIPKEEVRKQFSMVLQDSWIFEDTIANNIRFNQKEISQEDVIHASELAGLSHYINTLPKGYDTVLDDKEGLSDGQRQLLTIARAIALDAPILILDEATSSVDTRTEKLIQDAMDKLAKGRTSFVIAHRLSTIKNADKILVINEGEIVEKGTHESLLNLDGFYKELYQAQFDV